VERLALRERILMCEECELSAACNGPVPFSGPVPADFAILGEAPGETEDKKGAPFLGRAGALLRMYLEEVGLDEKRAFICNTVSCFPNGTPRRGHIIACKQNKDDQLDISGARYVLVLGGIALNSFRPDLRITKAHGRPFTIGRRVYLPTFHPAAALRKHDWEVEMQRGIGIFAQLLRACENDSEAWYQFVPDTCVECGADIETMEAIHYDANGITYCPEHWALSPDAMKESA
jgi:uracil-DNA glycosylase